tara:strand:- start:3639 stop:4016 length:378 start_codon:yes stop_codon:yes gene_type:complete
MKKKASNRSFGLLFFLVFLAIALWPLINYNPIRLWALVISSVFLILGLLNAKILEPLNRGWIKFGELLGKIIAPIIMFLVFFIILTPIGLILKLFRKDLLKIKKNKSIKSYWTHRKNITSMDRQF